MKQKKETNKMNSGRGRPKKFFKLPEEVPHNEDFLAQMDISLARALTTLLTYDHLVEVSGPKFDVPVSKMIKHVVAKTGIELGIKNREFVGRVVVTVNEKAK